jgi:hypothetical protein
VSLELELKENQFACWRREHFCLEEKHFFCVLLEKKHILGAEMSAILVGILRKKPPSRN